MKGYSILIISLYLDHGSSLRVGVNARKLSSLGSFLRTTSCPWIVAGDFNVPPETPWRSGWPTALGAATIASVPGGSSTWP
eukprot:4610816-Pyramimonas_sp.AAC.1